MFSVLPETYAICRLTPDGGIPAWACKGAFYSITRCMGELSVVCPRRDVPAGVNPGVGWRCLKIEGVLDFSETGIIAEIAGILNRSGVSIFALSTYDTDCVLVKEAALGEAVRALGAGGHRVVRQDRAQP